MNIGDTIIFTLKETDQTLECQIKKIRLYPNVRALLTTEGVERTLSSGLDLEKGIEYIESFPNYKQ